MALSENSIKAAHEVQELHGELKRHRNPELLRMGEMKKQYDGDIVLPFPELNTAERPAVANLIALGIDQNAMSVASVRPAIIFDALSTTDAAIRRASDSRNAVIGWQDMNDWDLLARRRARHLVAYGETIVSLSPCGDDKRDKRNIPHWRVRNPLSSYPAPSSNPSDMQPDYCIFETGRSVAWFQRNYPDKVGQLFPGKTDLTARYEVLEYVDDHETVLVGIGSIPEPRTLGSLPGNRKLPPSSPTAVLLERVTNETGICGVVVAGRITLDRIQGQYDQALGIEHRRATLDALNTIAIFRNVFPDEWAVSPSNSSSSARIVRRADGKKNIIGIIDKGQLQIVRPPLNQEIGMALDRYEASTRQFGVPAQFGGESPSNVRTARQSDQVLGAAVNMDLMENQDLLARAAELEIYIGINIAKTYFGKTAVPFFFGKDGKFTKTDYTPNETFITDVCRVKYPMPGRDVNGMAVAFGQKHGIGEMSLQTIRELDPDIDDAATEAERVEIEDLERAFMTQLEQGGAQGTMDPVKYARIVQMRKDTKKSIIECTIAVDNEMKQEQADLANQQAQAAQPGQAPTATPEQQPGLAGQPGQAVPAQGGKPSLESLLGSLTNVPSEVQPNAVAQAAAPAPAGV